MAQICHPCVMPHTVLHSPPKQPQRAQIRRSAAAPCSLLHDDPSMHESTPPPPTEHIGTRSVHSPCIEIRRAARPPQKGQNGCLAVRPGWRPSGVIAEARNARPSMSDMPWLGPARLPPSRSPRSIRPRRSVGAVERASEANWRFFRRRASERWIMAGIGIDWHRLAYI